MFVAFSSCALLFVASSTFSLHSCFLHIRFRFLSFSFFCLHIISQLCVQLFDLGDPDNKGRVSKTGFRNALEMMSLSGVSLLKMTTEDMEVCDVHCLRM